jgi:pimeloyl-ACP methyl ester carboxylesterase
MIAKIITMKRIILLVLCIMVLGSFGSVISQHLEKKYTKAIRYLFYLPENYGKDTTMHWPLILFLHGGGERGDNLERVKANGVPKFISSGKKLPFIVVSPQVSSNELWNPDLLVIMLKDIVKNYKVDKERIYLTGLSIGGLGTWETAEKYPDLFAAIAPVSSWGDPAQEWKLRHTAAWIFHGAKDRKVPVISSQVMADSLRKLNTDVRLTVYPNAGHDCWTETYFNEKLYEWFLDHKRFRFQEAVLKDSPEKFTGLFISEKDTATVSSEKGKLWIRYGFKGSNFSVLKPASGNTFFMDENSLNEIKYIMDNNGFMTSFLFYENSRRAYLRIK